MLNLVIVTYDIKSMCLELFPKWSKFKAKIVPNDLIKNLVRQKSYIYVCVFVCVCVCVCV
jgi:hypothetical protein